VQHLHKSATARRQSHNLCEAALTDLRDRLKQTQQLLDAGAGRDGSSEVKLDNLKQQLMAARYLSLSSTPSSHVVE